MNINEVERLVKEFYPELARIVAAYNEVSAPLCWHLYTYLDSKVGTLGIETTFTPSALSGSSEEDIEKLTRVLRSAFSHKLEEENG